MLRPEWVGTQHDTVAGLQQIPHPPQAGFGMTGKAKRAGFPRPLRGLPSSQRGRPLAPVGVNGIKEAGVTKENERNGCQAVDRMA